MWERESESESASARAREREREREEQRLPILQTLVINPRRAASGCFSSLESFLMIVPELQKKNLKAMLLIQLNLTYESVWTATCLVKRKLLCFTSSCHDQLIVIIIIMIIVTTTTTTTTTTTATTATMMLMMMMMMMMMSTDA